MVAAFTLTVLTMIAPQQAPIPISVTSDNSLVYLNATVHESESAAGRDMRGFVIDLEVANHSLKPITLLITKVTISKRLATDNAGLKGYSLPVNGITNTEDLYFREKLLEPEKALTSEIPVRLVGTTSGNNEILSANVSLGYVQFKDGSSWGDQNVGLEALEQREHQPGD
jgi:hypothetical protein